MGKNTKFNHFMRVKDEAHSINARVIREQLNFDEYLKVIKQIENHPSYNKLTNQSKNYISGYNSGIFHMIQTCLTEWRLYDKDGNLVLTGHSAEGLNYKFDYSVCKQRELAGLPIGHSTWVGSNGEKIWS